jgi:hypothetical protein
VRRCGVGRTLGLHLSVNLAFGLQPIVQRAAVLAPTRFIDRMSTRRDSIHPGFC